MDIVMRTSNSVQLSETDFLLEKTELDLKRLQTALKNAIKVLEEVAQVDLKGEWGMDQVGFAVESYQRQLHFLNTSMDLQAESVNYTKIKFLLSHFQKKLVIKLSSHQALKREKAIMGQDPEDIDRMIYYFRGHLAYLWETMYKGLLNHKGNSLDSYDKSTVRSFIDILEKLKGNNVEPAKNRSLRPEYYEEEEIKLLNKLNQGENIRKKTEKKRGDLQALDSQLDEYRHALLELWVELKCISKDYDMYTRRPIVRRRSEHKKGTRKLDLKHRPTDPELATPLLRIRGSKDVDLEEFKQSIVTQLENLSKRKNVKTNEFIHMVEDGIKLFSNNRDLRTERGEETDNIDHVISKYEKYHTALLDIEKSHSDMDSEDYTLYRNLLGELVGDMNTLTVPQDALIGKLKDIVSGVGMGNTDDLASKLECLFGEVIDRIVEGIGNNKIRAGLDSYKQLAPTFGKNTIPDTSFNKYIKAAEVFVGDLTDSTGTQELRSYLKELLLKLYAKQVSQASNSDTSHTLSLNSIKPFLHIPEKQLGLQDLSSIHVDLKSQLYDSKDNIYLGQYEEEKSYIEIITEKAKNITGSDSSKLNSEDHASPKVIAEETKNNSVQDAMSHNSKNSAVNDTIENGDNLIAKDSSKHNSEDSALNEPSEATESELTYNMQTPTPTTQVDSQQPSSERIERISVLESCSGNSNESEDNSVSRGIHPPPKAEAIEFPVVSEIIETIVKSLNSLKSQENSSPSKKMLNKHLNELKTLESEFAGGNSSLLTSERLRSKLLPTLQSIIREYSLDSHLLDSLLELLNNPSLLTAQILKQIPDHLDASFLNTLFSALMAQASEHARDPAYYLAQQKFYESLPACYLGQQAIPQYIQSISRIESDNVGIDLAHLQDARNKLEQLVKCPSALSGAIEEFIKGLQFQGSSIKPLNSLFCTLAAQATIHINSSKENNKIQPEKAEELLRFYDSFIETMENAKEEEVNDSFRATQMHPLFECNHRLINDYEYLANESSDKPIEDIGNLKKLLVQMNGINDAIYEEENEDLDDLSNYPAHIIQLINELKNQLTVTTDPQDIEINNEIQQTLKRELDTIYRNLEDRKEDKNYKVKLLQDLAEGYQFIHDLGNKNSRIKNKIDKYIKYAEELASAKNTSQNDYLIKPLPFDYKELIKLFNFIINSSHTLKSTIGNKNQEELGRLNKMIAMYRGLIASMKLGMQKGLSNNPLNKPCTYYKKMIAKVLKDLNSIETKLEVTTIREFDNAIAKASSLLDKLNGIKDILQINGAANVEEIQGTLEKINEEFEKLKVFVHRKEGNDIEESIFQNSHLIERLKATQMFMHRTNSSSQEKIITDYLEVYMPDLLRESENIITERVSVKCSPEAVIKGIAAWKAATSAIKGNTEQEYLAVIKGVIDIIRWHEEILTFKTSKSLDTFSTHISLSYSKKLLSSIRKFYHSTAKAKKRHSNTDFFHILSGLIKNLNFILKEKKRLREDTHWIEQYLSHYTQLAAAKQDPDRPKRETSIRNVSNHTAGELSQIYSYISEKLSSLREYPSFRALLSTHKANFEQNKPIPGFIEELESILCTVKSKPHKELKEILSTIETMLTGLAIPQASPVLHEDSLRGLHKIFTFYSCNSQSLTLQNFLLFGSDFGVFDLQTSRSKKMIRIDTAKKFFRQLSQDSPTISEQNFSTLLEELSHLYFDRDVISNSQVSHSSSPNKFAAFLELLGCHEPQQYQKTLSNSQCKQLQQRSPSLSPEKPREASLLLRRLPTYHDSPHSKTPRNNTQLSRIDRLLGKSLIRNPTMPHYELP